MFQIQNFNVERVLSVYNNQTDELVVELPLTFFDLPRFRQHFGVPDNDEDSEMIMEYAVGLKDVKFLSKYLAETEDVYYDFDKYAYFLSCYRVDE